MKQSMIKKEIKKATQNNIEFLKNELNKILSQDEYKAKSGVKNRLYINKGF